MGFAKTFKNGYTFECWLKFEPKSAITLDMYYKEYGHCGLYFYLDVFGLGLDISFYGPEDDEGDDDNDYICI